MLGEIYTYHLYDSRTMSFFPRYFWGIRDQVEVMNRVMRCVMKTARGVSRISWYGIRIAYRIGRGSKCLGSETNSAGRQRFSTSSFSCSSSEIPGESTEKEILSFFWFRRIDHVLHTQSQIIESTNRLGGKDGLANTVTHLANARLKKGTESAVQPHSENAHGHCTVACIFETSSDGYTVILELVIIRP
jgi:hypothetical protein